MLASCSLRRRARSIISSSVISGDDRDRPRNSPGSGPCVTNPRSRPFSHRWVGTRRLAPVSVSPSSSRVTAAPPETETIRYYAWRCFSWQANVGKEDPAARKSLGDQMDQTAFTDIYVGLHSSCPALHPGLQRQRHPWRLDSSFLSLTDNLEDRKLNTATIVKQFRRFFSNELIFFFSLKTEPTCSHESERTLCYICCQHFI